MQLFPLILTIITKLYSDSSFQQSLHKEKDKIVIKGIIELLNKLNIRTVAEGIETTEQVAFLKAINCNMIQCYYFYRPLPESAFDEVLAQEYAKAAQPESAETNTRLELDFQNA